MENMELSVFNVVESESVACVKDRQEGTHKGRGRMKINGKECKKRKGG